MCIAKWNVSWASGLILGTFLLTFCLEPEPCKPRYLNHSSMKVWLEKETEKQVPTNCVIFGSACMESRKACWDGGFCFRLSQKNLLMSSRLINVMMVSQFFPTTHFWIWNLLIDFSVAGEELFVFCCLLELSSGSEEEIFKEHKHKFFTNQNLLSCGALDVTIFTICAGTDSQSSRWNTDLPLVNCFGWQFYEKEKIVQSFPFFSCKMVTQMRNKMKKIS
jgi:hypothetical protein